MLVRRPTDQRLAAVAAAIRSEPAFPVVAASLRSRHGSAALLSAYARADVSQRVWRDAARRVDERLGAIEGVAMGGAALATTQVNSQIQDDLAFAERIAFPLLFLLTLWVFRSLVAALLPIVCAGAPRILGGLLLLRLLDLAMPVSSYALNIVTGIGLGLGIDYSLLLVSRYREELARHGPGPEAVRRTMATAGRTVAFSSVTVAAAVATLAIFPLGYLRSMGIAGGAVAPLAGLIALTVLPALFVLLGERVNALSPGRWRRAAERAASGKRGGWYRLAQALMRRPVPVAVAATAVLVVLSLPFLGVRFTGIDASVLPTASSRRGWSTRRSGVSSRRPPCRRFSPSCAGPSGARAYAGAVEAPVVQPPRRLAEDVWLVTASSGKPFLDAAVPSGSSVEMRSLPADALVGGSTAQFLDQKASLGSLLPLAAALLAVVTFVLLCSRALPRPAGENARDERADAVGHARASSCSSSRTAASKGCSTTRSQGSIEPTQPRAPACDRVRPRRPTTPSPRSRGSRRRGTAGAPNRLCSRGRARAHGSPHHRRGTAVLLRHRRVRDLPDRRRQGDRRRPSRPRC